MLTHHRKSVCLSLVCTDLPIWSIVETGAILYQKDKDHFHLLLTEPAIIEQESEPTTPELDIDPKNLKSRRLWLEISPYRLIMTMQGNGGLSYRHLWESGVYGISRYWLNSDSRQVNSLRMRNFTRSVMLKGNPLPKQLKVEYDLWSEKVHMGRYVLSLEINH